MLPPMVRDLVSRQSRASVGMTAAGAGTGALLEQLTAITDPTSPGARAAFMHQLAALGVDTPELLRILEDTTPGTAAAAEGAAGLLTRDASDLTTRAAGADGDPGAPPDIARAAEQATRGSRSLEQIVARLTGNPALGATEISVDQDAYWGDFAPAKIVTGGAEHLLRALVGGDKSAMQRVSALAFGAELGELLAVERMQGERAGASTLAQSTAKATRGNAEGAPTKAAQLARAEQVAKRRATLEQRKQLVAEQRAARVQQAETQQIQARDAALAQRTTEVETFTDRVAGAIAESMRGGAAARVAGASAFGWDGEALPLTVTGEDGGLAARVAGAGAPWEAPKAASTRSTAGEQAERFSGLFTKAAPQHTPGGFGMDRADNPLVAALRDSAADRPVDAGTDHGPLGRALGALGGRVTPGDGSRDFTAMGSSAIRAIMRSLPTRKSVAQFLGSGFDLTYAVLDRANGAFAGLDAGVLRFLASTRLGSGGSGGGQSSDNGREIFPGLDEWPADTLETLRAAGWGDGAEAAGASQSQAQPLTEARVERLERRVDAAKEAYARLNASQARGGRAPQSVDAVDWSLVDTGAARAAPQSADMGRLANTMVRPSDAPMMDMAKVAPAVKVVAQQAQLKPKRESVGTAGAGAQHTQGPQGRSLGPKKRINYDALAGQIARRLARRWALERDRHGK